MLLYSHASECNMLYELHFIYLCVGSIGITATAQDLINEEAVAQQDKPGIQIEEVRQEVEADNSEFPR